MFSSAIFMGILGIILTFAPEEVAKNFDLNISGKIFLQLLGALYFGFAMLNYMAKDNLIGGIFLKPISVANFSHFFIGAMALLKYLLKNNSPYLWGITIVYMVFALIFGKIFTTNPSKNN